MHIYSVMSYMNITSYHGWARNQELKLVENWIKANKLVINIERTKCMVLGSVHLLHSSPVLSGRVGGKVVEQVSVDSKMLIKMVRSMAAGKYCRKCIPRRAVQTFVEQLNL